MKRSFSLKYIVPVVAPVLADVILAVTGMSRVSVLDTVCLTVFAVCALLLMLPLSTEKDRASKLFSHLLSTVFVLCLCLGCPADILMVIMLTILLVYMINRGVFLNLGLGKFLNRRTVFEALEHAARSSFVLGLSVLGAFLVYAVHDGRMEPVALVLNCAAVCLILYRTATGRTLIFNSSLEERIRSMSGIAPKDKPERVAEIAESASLFRRIEAVMEEKKPYLKDDYCVDDLARMTFSNHTYLSRAINTYAGKNFRGFINAYRIRYAVELMENDTLLTVSEVAQMSGFRTSNTFKKAFKDSMGMRPYEYMTKLRREKVRTDQ